MRMTVKAAVWAGVLSLALAGGAATTAVAHEGTLPEDALTLVKQASALLAQNPGMSGEAKERLRAAQQSKRPEGVDLAQVAAALQALDAGDTAGARRFLVTAIMPAGMAMPPAGAQPSAPSAPSPSVQAPPQAAPPPSADVAMKMAEPLRSSYGGSSPEIALLAVAAGLVLLGLVLVVRREPEVHR